MIRHGLVYAFMTLSVSASVAHADCVRALQVDFLEDAPRDRFTIVHTATGVVLTGMQIDLQQSSGGLIFDTEEGGRGLDVFQPFQGDALVSAETVRDGAQVLDLGITFMKAGDRAAFSLDVDDSLTRSDLGQTRVTGAEIAGARVVFYVQDGAPLEAVFDAQSRAKVCG